MAELTSSIEREAIWQRIEREASAQAALDVQRDEATPLVYGDPIAWVDCMHARTDALSSVHRVGFPQNDDPYTSCGIPIPAPSRWLILSPRFIQSLGPCRFCDAECARALKEGNAA